MSGRPHFTRRDPASHIASLPFNTKQPDDLLPHDVILSFHARLIACLRDFLHRQNQFRSSLSDSEAFPTSRYARLASGTNSQLQFWLSDLEGYDLATSETRRLMVTYYFARILVNHPSVDIFQRNGKEDLANAARSLAVDAAVDMLETCIAWEAKDDLPHLPWSSFRVSCHTDRADVR